jgi:DNA primase
MGRIPEQTIERIIESNDIVDVISEYVALKRSGKGYMGVCPFHNDKGPSMSVSQDKQLFHCFGCGASGNVLGFIMRIRNMDFIDALKYLGDRAGIQIEYKEEDPSAKRENIVKDKIFQINIEAARFFFKNLPQNADAYNYLKGRGIDEKIIKKFGLGYSPNDWHALLNFLKSKGYDENLIFKSGLILKGNKGYYDRFRNRIMFPVFDIKGRVVGFGGRVMDDSKPKYLNSPETPVFVKGTNLYGLNFVIKSGLPDSIIIVEGYMDCIALHQHGINNAVASLGTALTVEQAKLLKRYSKNIFVCYDSDEAGKAATLRGLDILTQLGCDVRVITIPKGKDPDEFIKLNGVDEFKALVENALPVLEYKLKRAREGINFKDPAQKAKFVSATAKILSETENEIQIQTYSSKIYDETGVDVKSILDEVKKIKEQKQNKENNKWNNRNNINGNIYNAEPAYKKAEKQLLRLCLMNDDYFKFIKNKISIDDFISDVYKTTAAFVFEKLEYGEDVKPNDILVNFHNENDINDVSQIFHSEELHEDVYKLIDDYVRTIKRFNLESKINEITVAIKRYEDNNEFEKSADLIQNLIGLQKQLDLL